MLLINPDAVNFINNLSQFTPILSILVAFLVAFYSMPIIIKLAIKKELVAKPNHRTSHKGRIPNLGGVGIFLGFISAFLCTANLGVIPNLQYFLLGLIWMFFIGLRDDILIISARKKFFGEIIAVIAVVVLGNIRLTDFHGFLTINEINYPISVLFTVFVAIVIINALNLIDGIDGLASGVGIIASLFFGISFLIAGGTQNTQLAILAFCSLGALIPFFIYNVFGLRNKIFMGDAGALSLGFIISLLVIKFCENNIQSTDLFPKGTTPIIAISVLILPLFDTLRVFIIRTMQGKSPFRPDKNHLHHNLLALGYTHKQATAILLTFNIALIIISVIGSNLAPWALFSIVSGLAVFSSEFIRLKLKNKQGKERNLQVSTYISTVKQQSKN